MVFPKPVSFKLKKLIDKEKPNYLIIHLITVVPLLLLYLFSFDTKFVLRISGLPKLTFFRTFFWKKISNNRGKWFFREILHKSYIRDKQKNQEQN